MVFRVLTPKEETAATSTAKALKSMGIKIVDLLESSMVDSKSGESVYDVFALVCKTNRLKYKYLLKHSKYSQIIWEGVKTLI